MCGCTGRQGQTQSLAEERTSIPAPPIAAEPAQSGPFVGREKELRRLMELFELARSNQRQVLFISGGAGSGKTALVEAFSRMLRQNADGTSARVLVGHCFEQFGATEPYMPVWEAIGGEWREEAYIAIDY